MGPGHNGAYRATAARPPGIGDSVLRNYELITILNPAGVDAGRKALQDICSRHNVSLGEETDWGEKRLPHELEDLTNGRFLHYTAKVDPTKLKELSHDLGLDGAIARFMIKRAG
jgi:small subunit ribosomal protein S6